MFQSKNLGLTQEADYTKETVKAGTEYVKEYVIEQEGVHHQQVNFWSRNVLSFFKCAKEKVGKQMSAGEPGGGAGGAGAAGAGGGGGGAEGDAGVHNHRLPGQSWGASNICHLLLKITYWHP